MNFNKYIPLVFALFLIGTLPAFAQVKIGENHKEINAGALLELESSTQGVLFPRREIVDINKWELIGDPVEGMVVYNNGTHHPKGLYVWDNDSETWVMAGGTNGNVETKDVCILYGVVSKGVTDIDLDRFDKDCGPYTHLPNDYRPFRLPQNKDDSRVYAFALPQSWDAPRIFLDSSKGKFYLSDCWSLVRNIDYNGILYQVWVMDTSITTLNTVFKDDDPFLEFLFQ